MESGKARELNMREDRVNLYGVPFRTWVLMRNSSTLDMERSISQSDQLRSNQFSSQERNQDSLNEILHEVHDDFHTYFVLIVTVLCGMISAIVFLIILATIAKCCCSRGSANKVSDIILIVKITLSLSELSQSPCWMPRNPSMPVYSLLQRRSDSLTKYSFYPEVEQILHFTINDR